MIGTLIVLALEIMEFANERGRTIIGEAVKLTGANRNTVKKQLQTFVSGNYLAQHGSSTVTWYGRV